MHPAGLDFISVTYEADGQTQRLFFSPYESWFGLPSNFNRIVAEWFAALRAAVLSATGREPGNTPAEQLGVPSGAKAIYAWLLAPVVLGGTLLFALGRQKPGEATTFPFIGSPMIFIFAMLALAVLAPFVLGRFFGGPRKPAAPPRFSRTAIVALVLSISGCMLALLIGLVLFQSWGWVYGSFFVIETAALILGIVAWERRTGKAAVILSSAIMLAWIPGVISHLAQVAPGNVPMQPPRDAGATMNSTRQLSQGSVELVAISYHPSTNQPWWRPDGSSCQEGPLELRGSHSSGAADRMTREFVIRLTGLPPDASWPVWKLDPASGWAGGAVYLGSQPASHLHGISTALPQSLRTVTVKVGIALGAWQTVAKQVPGGSGMTSFSREGSNWVVSFPKAERTEGGARVLVVHTVKDRDLRVLAVDKNGQEHLSSGGESSGTDAFSHLTAPFPGLPLEQVKEFQFQLRPYQWVEFRAVALYPKQPLAGTNATTFGPVLEGVDHSSLVAFKLRERPPTSAQGNGPNTRADARRFPELLVCVNNLWLGRLNFGSLNGCSGDVGLTGKVACGHPRAESEVSWTWLRATPQGDEYRFMRRFPADLPSASNSVKMVVYAGQETVLWQDDLQQILLRPKTPAGRPRLQSRRVAEEQQSAAYDLMSDPRARAEPPGLRIWKEVLLGESGGAAPAGQAVFEPAQAARHAAPAEFGTAGNPTNSDFYSRVTGHAYFCQGKPRAGLEGWDQGWKVETNGLVNTEEAARISTKTRFGKEDLSVTAALSLDQLNGSGAAFTFGYGYAFEFDRTDGRFTVSGPTVLRSYQQGSAAGAITPGKRFMFEALRRGSLFDFLVDQKLVLSVQFDREIGAVGFTPGKGTLRIYAFGAYEFGKAPTIAPG
jgi:hypothetical protein